MGGLFLKKYYLVALILGSLYAQVAYSARWATVIANKAIIYSDVQMTSEIGFVLKGKKVRVGEKARNHGKLLPIIVNKRVAYIRIKDLQTSNRLEALQSASQRIKKQAKSKETKKSRASVYASTLYNSVQFPESATAESEVSILFLGFGLRGYKLFENKRDGFRAGIEYMRGVSGDHDFSYWSVPADYYYKLLQTDYSDIYAYAGAGIIPFAEYKLGSLFTLNGYGVTANAGAEIVFKYDDYAIHLDGAYQYTKFMGFSIKGDNPDYPSTLEPSAHGVKLQVALSFIY